MSEKKHRTLRTCTCAECFNRPTGRVAQDHRAINQVLIGLDEKHRRRFVGLLAQQWGHGGIQRLIEITGLSRNTICRGRTEISQADVDRSKRIRKTGGGRKRVEKNSRCS